ncbi:MAG TPA: helix-turn-helix domain-containing protein [Amycolatopsis sp.]|nr:helix-turn-helix domain-containing protein [Amycolatopsis sp.]
MPTDARPLRRDAQRNRELLVAAAREVFGAKGLDAPLEEIARRAGVAIGTLYNRFPTRATLIEAAFAGLIDEWAAIGEQALRADDPWQGLADFAMRTCEMQSVDRGLTEVCVGTLPGTPAIEAAKVRAWQVTSRLVERVRESGRLRADFQPGDLPLAIAAATRVAEISPDDDAWRRHLGYLLDGFRAR